MKSPPPRSLNYLQPFLRKLARRAPQERNEDVDPSLLEKALRKRLQGLDEVAAAVELAKDRELLETWLTTSASGDHPAYWVLGFLSLPNLASEMLRPAAPQPREPTITFEAPKGWKVKAVPFRLDLKSGKLIGEITAFRDEWLFKAAQRQKEYWPPGLPLTRQTLDVSFGGCAGKKYLSTLPFKSVDYLLAVPGGFVSCMLSALGADFDESIFEAKLPTLHLSEDHVTEKDAGDIRGRG